MQSHCVCSCVCAMKWFFLASASEYSQWKCYYKRQQVVSAELIKDCDCRSTRCDWQSWAEELLLPSSSLSSGKAIQEEMEMLEILGSSERVMRRWLITGKHLLIYLSFPLWAVPLMLLRGVPSMASLPACFKQEFQAFFGAAAVSWCKNSS